MKQIGDKIWVLATVVEADERRIGGMTYRVALEDAYGVASRPHWVAEKLVDDGRGNEVSEPTDEPQNVLQRIFDDLRKLGVVR